MDRFDKLFLIAQVCDGWVVGEYIEKVLFPRYENTLDINLNDINICIWFDNGNGLDKFLQKLNLSIHGITKIETIDGFKLRDRVSYFRYDEFKIHLLTYPRELLISHLLLTHHNITYNFIHNKFDYLSTDDYYPIHHPIKQQLIHPLILNSWTKELKPIITQRILKYIKDGWCIYLDELDDFNLKNKDKIINYLQNLPNYMEKGFTVETWEQFTNQLDI